MKYNVNDVDWINMNKEMYDKIFVVDGAKSDMDIDSYSIVLSEFDNKK